MGGTKHKRLQDFCGWGSLAPPLREALSGETGTSSAGFPYLSHDAFAAFLQGVPHLFSSAYQLLNQLDEIDAFRSGLPEGEGTDLKNSVAVIRRVVLTAAITAPSDLWLARFIFSAHAKLGLMAKLERRGWLCRTEIEAMGISYSALRTDLHFLHSRGWLEWNQERDRYRLKDCPQTLALGQFITPLNPGIPADMVPVLRQAFSIQRTTEGTYERSVIDEFCRLPADAPSPRSWVATYEDIELGFRVVPIVLALRTLDLTSRLQSGVRMLDICPQMEPSVAAVLHRAGYLDDDKVTTLGARVFSRGPGPFGIIHAYHPYMTHLEAILKGQPVNSWVARSANVAASQDANRKTFEKANDSLDRFCERYGFAYNVFIEHAVGQGEATRQRFAKSGEDSIRYFGADLEDAAIDQAILAQEAGQLPKGMQFIRSADIGQPDTLLNGLRLAGADPEGAVMIVGNGFHEIRNQDNDRMIEVFENYCQAGLIIIFTEESGLPDEDLIATAWNTYHAGFRYVHERSGQGLRPAIDKHYDSQRYSWFKCAALAGYDLPEEFMTRTRKIFPYPRDDGYNPAISVNYFCVPHRLAQKLGLLE